MLEFGRSVGVHRQDRKMDTSLISAMFAAKIGQLQLVVAARLVKTDPQSGVLVGRLIAAAQQNFEPPESAATGPGTNLDISC
jgi:hypothetical protein